MPCPGGPLARGRVVAVGTAPPGTMVGANMGGGQAYPLRIEGISSIFMKGRKVSGTFSFFCSSAKRYLTPFLLPPWPGSSRRRASRPTELATTSARTVKFMSPRLGRATPAHRRYGPQPLRSPSGGREGAVGAHGAGPAIPSWGAVQRHRMRSTIRCLVRYLTIATKPR